MHVRLTEWWEANGSVAGPPRDKIAAKLDRVRDELEHAVAEGVLTRAQAAEKLAAIERQMAQERERINLDGHRVQQQRKAPSPGEIVWVSLAPALARAAESGTLAKDQIKMIHTELIARFDEAMAVEGEGEPDHAAMKSMFDHIVSALAERGVPEADLQEAVHAAHRNLIRFMARDDWRHDQLKRELEAREHEHEHEHPDH